MVQPKAHKKRLIASLSRSLRVKIRLSGLALTVERFARAFWPCVAALLAMFSMLVWQVHAVLSYPFDLGMYGVFIAVVLIFLWKGLRRFSRATQDEAIVRLDQTGHGNPVTTLIDRQFIGTDDADTQQLWQLHQHRMAKQADLVEVRAPHVRLAKRDPWALRLIALLFFGSAIFFGRAGSDQSITETLQDLASGTTGVTVSYEAWAEPPAYTGFPVIYLNTLANDTVLKLPVGTQFILRSYGTSALEIISEVAELADDQKALTEERRFKVSKSGAVTLKKGFRTVAHWDITMIPDAPPSVELTGEITRTVQGSVQLPYAARDDYGITGGIVEIKLEMDKLDRRFGLVLEPEKIDPITFDLPVPFHGDVKDIKETVVEDLANHPWAGLPVEISLRVNDAAGNIAAIDPVYMPMPGKRFFDTLAAALVEQRRDVLWNRDNIDRVDMILKTLTYLPDDGFPNQKAYLMVRSVIRRIGYTPMRPVGDKMLNDTAETLWRSALLIEDGDLSDAAARLKRAQERLSEAMKNGATKDEIAELMEELRKATDEYIRQLAENAQPQDQQADNQNTQQISPDMIQEMMDRIQELMEQGRMDEAQALLNQLQQMLENIQITQGGKAQDGQGQEGAEGLQDTLRQQQDLADENFQQMQEQFSKNQEGQEQGNQQEQPDKGDGQEQGDKPQNGNHGDLADRQEALRDLMEQQLGQLGDDNSEAGTAAREALKEAERKMGQARDNLEQGQGAEALDNQADAVEALRQGMRQLDKANQQARQGQARDGQGDSETAGPDADPLGRSTAESGSLDSNGKFLQSDEQLRRSKEILEEIRRRSGERNRPQLELDYLDRLLDRF